MSGLTPVNFNNEIVITTKTLAGVYECDVSNIKVNLIATRISIRNS